MYTRANKNNKRTDKHWTSGRDKDTFFASQVELLTWLPICPSHPCLCGLPFAHTNSCAWNVPHPPLCLQVHYQNITSSSRVNLLLKPSLTSSLRSDFSQFLTYSKNNLPQSFDCPMLNHSLTRVT